MKAKHIGYCHCEERGGESIHPGGRNVTGLLTLASEKNKSDEGGNKREPTQLRNPTMSNEAFTQLVDAHYAALYRFALSLARNGADAGDLVQQTFFIWATKGSALREQGKAKSWLFTTLYREFLRGRRRDARATSIEDLPAAERELAAEEIDRVGRLDAAVVMTALQSVDEVFRAPLTLFYLEDLSYLEIAETLEVPIGTVMSRLSRGKAQLRTALASEERGSGAKVVAFTPAKGVKT
jgi:RNA polymerase sigma factor (sigma-70 family)